MFGKNPARRLRDIGDAWLLLRDSSAPPTASSKVSVRVATAYVFAAATVGAIAFALGIRTPWRGVASPPRVVRFQLIPPEQSTLRGDVAVSPDGRSVAFLARGADGQVQVWVQSLETLGARVIQGTEGTIGLFWSPDSRYIGFGAGQVVRRVEAAGGPAQTLGALPFTFRGGAWNREGVIIVGTARSGLFKLSETGEPQL